MKRACIFIMMLSSLFSFAQQKVEESYKEKYRPQYHFSPQKGWIGDPDGLVYSDGKYHLYWWGHAISEDLVHWKELPYPMKGGDGKFSYFSGSVVVDRKNTSGFGENSMIAFYTKHLPGDTIPETQAISVSNDQGVSYN
jgi:fructan beta-fructosidase